METTTRLRLRQNNSAVDRRVHRDIDPRLARQIAVSRRRRQIAHIRNGGRGGGGGGQLRIERLHV